MSASPSYQMKEGWSDWPGGATDDFSWASTLITPMYKSMVPHRLRASSSGIAGLVTGDGLSGVLAMRGDLSEL